MNSHSGSRPWARSSTGPATTGRRPLRTAHSIHRSVAANWYRPSSGSIADQGIGTLMKSATADRAFCPASWKARGSTPAAQARHTGQRHAVGLGRLDHRHRPAGRPPQRTLGTGHRVGKQRALRPGQKPTPDGLVHEQLAGLAGVGQRPPGGRLGLHQGRVVGVVPRGVAPGHQRLGKILPSAFEGRQRRVVGRQHRKVPVLKSVEEPHDLLAGQLQAQQVRPGPLGQQRRGQQHPALGHQLAVGRLVRWADGKDHLQRDRALPLGQDRQQPVLGTDLAGRRRAVRPDDARVRQGPAFRRRAVAMHEEPEHRTDKPPARPPAASCPGHDAPSHALGPTPGPLPYGHATHRADRARHAQRHPPGPPPAAQGQGPGRVRPGRRHRGHRRHRSPVGLRRRPAHPHPGQGTHPDGIVGLLVPLAGGPQPGTDPLHRRRPDAARPRLRYPPGHQQGDAPGTHHPGRPRPGAAHRVRGPRLPRRLGLARLPAHRHDQRGGPARRPAPVRSAARADLHPQHQGEATRARRADRLCRRRRASGPAAGRGPSRTLAGHLPRRRRARAGAGDHPGRHQVRVRPADGSNPWCARADARRRGPDARQLALLARRPLRAG
ncbi:MAG: hypothetical protein KatS3mg103_0551 [Phycisphaerales bacterium]|nr:MAG: hypothetical protein KatS3mg103_0551 [Phycisphaerales bacterium]